MDEEKPKCSSSISVESQHEMRLSVRSVGRSIPSSPPKSASHSLIEVMSLERSRRSRDLYDKLLNSDNGSGRFNAFDLKKSNNSSSKNGHQNLRFSYEERQNKLVQHICTCALTCKQEACPCFDYAKEPCVIEMCCRKCVEAKELVLRNALRHRGSVKIKQTVKVSCTCFKTQCLKKYCTCLAAGVKCGRNCKCQNCQNWGNDEPQMVAEDVYLQTESNTIQMPEKMEFQPFDYKDH